MKTSRAKKTSRPSRRPRIVLASASPRRRDLLSEAGFEFEVEPSHTQEIAHEHFTVREIVLWNAKAKAEEVSRRRPDALVIGADTLVAIDGAPLGKPRDLNDAHAMLRRLNGRAHEVFSGVWLSWGTRQQALGFVQTSRVSFRELSEKEMRDYLRRIDPLDKAGAYAAQEENDATRIIAKIDGSRTNVIGLPMEMLKKALRIFSAARA